MAEKKNNKNVEAWERIINKLLGSVVTIVSTIATVVGVPGIAVIGLFWMINKFSNSFQKSELIDKYVLFNDGNYCNYIMIFLLLAITIYIVFHRKTVQTLQNEINRVTSHKTKLEELLSRKPNKNHTKTK